MNRKTLYIIGGSIFGVVLGVFTFKLIKANREKQNAQVGITFDEGEEVGSIDDNTQSSVGAKESRDSFPIEVGGFGYKVSVLQSALNSLGASLTVDGKYGAKTYDAVGEHGGLGWTDWTYACEVGYWCDMTKERYNEILKNASKEGWSKEQAEGVASADWKEFAMSGDDWVYNNLTI